MAGYQKFLHVGLALDPIHVGTGGARLGRVDLTIVRDPVTRVPKIPGSSLAGVYRTYVAMALEEQRSQQESVNGQPRPYYPALRGLWASPEETTWGIARSPIARCARSSVSLEEGIKPEGSPAWPPSRTPRCSFSPCPPVRDLAGSPALMPYG
jgi:hypothetical protein